MPVAQPEHTRPFEIFCATKQWAESLQLSQWHNLKLPSALLRPGEERIAHKKMRYLISKRILSSAVKRNRLVRKREVRLPSEDTSEVNCILKDRDLWQKLPAEVLVNIFHFLNDGERCRASLACKNWRDVFYVASLWRKRCFVFGGEPL